MNYSALVIGGSGAIAQAVINKLLQSRAPEQIVAVSRHQKPADMPEIDWRQSDYSEPEMQRLVDAFKQSGLTFDRVIICHGVLHDDRVSPEKRLEDLDASAMLHVLNINAVTPALWLKYLLPVLKKSEQCHVAVFSARVGSISDNHLGGWYSYRASKATLNMVLKTTAIEYARRAPGVKLVAFHPGTTDTALSRPFSKNVPEGKLFSPDFVADQLLMILDSVAPDGKLAYLDWNRDPINW